jgi:hypothetical protein
MTAHPRDVPEVREAVDVEEFPLVAPEAAGGR